MRLRVTAPAAFVLRVLTFYWPGWTAYLDGAASAYRVSDPEGFIAVAIPAGSHTLALQLEDTPPGSRAGSSARRRWRRLPGCCCAVARPRRQGDARPGLSPSAGGGAGGAGGGRRAARIGWDANLRWRAANDVPVVAGAQVQRFTRFDNGMALAGFDFRAHGRGRARE